MNIAERYITFADSAGKKIEKEYVTVRNKLERNSSCEGKFMSDEELEKAIKRFKNAQKRHRDKMPKWLPYLQEHIKALEDKETEIENSHTTLFPEEDFFWLNWKF